MPSVKEIVESTGRAFPVTLKEKLAAIAEAMLEVDADDRSVLNDVYVTLKASASGNDSLASHFEKQEQRQIHAWKATEASLADERRHFSAQSDDDVRELFVSCVKNASLSAEDAMVLPYLLWGTEEQRKILAL
eukprot:PhM_4_TR18621/c1_g2_i3/m.27198